MKGSCNCGEIVFNMVGNLPALYQCHCSLCQKQSGAGANAATIIDLERFTWERGEHLISHWKGSDGFSSHFCKQCGSPVPNLIGTQYMWIPVGLIDQLETKVVAHLCLSSKSEWDEPVKAVRNYSEMPDDLDEFVGFLASDTSQI